MAVAFLAAACPAFCRSWGAFSALPARLLVFAARLRVATFVALLAGSGRSWGALRPSLLARLLSRGFFAIIPASFGPSDSVKIRLHFFLHDLCWRSN